ncbi:MAG: GH92 family glycosyl hydrolase [Crocinitomicaceae bacterium]|nr:GH92 family glycosyl hydrolase [Crocinitomicaceae bacterium]
MKPIAYCIFLFGMFTQMNAQVIKSLQKVSDKAHNVIQPQKKDMVASPVSLVNPFVGTGGHGHTFPGATAPFGMIQLSPDTRHEGWDGCSGYHYSDSVIYGFSHTHLSGTGVPDYCDLLIIPQSGKKAKVVPGYEDSKGFGSTFSHNTEIAKPGYYEVYLEDDAIKAQMTTSERAGIHQYTFQREKDKKFILIDFDHRDDLIFAEYILDDKKHISGQRISKSWAEEQHFYFDLEFSIEPSKIKRVSNKYGHKLLIEFPKQTKTLKIAIGISQVDEAGALKNRQTELDGFNFNKTRALTRVKWQKELSKIKISSEDREKASIFYTALYHCFIAPNLASDVDGRYRGHDQKIHELKEGEHHYTVFSLWDTYRTLHPLFTLIQPERTEEFIRTMLRIYDQRNDLPVWELASCETECMIGYHSVSAIADAYLKGYNDFDTSKALEAMVHTSKLDEYAKKEFATQGFISSDQEAESVSKTLEYAYDDFCIAQMAKKMGRMDLFKEYHKRSLNFVNLYDPSTKFMRARRGAQWFGPFNPIEVNFNYTEANSWQYSLYAPHNIPLLAELMGGKDSLETWLDRLFAAESDLIGRHQVDITGLIGQYAHGNEPSHHMAYLYNYTNAPEKTQLYVDQILSELYTIQSDGLSGNEDCGQMSAWYVMSALGLYPIAPGNTNYQIGRPLFKKAEIKLPNRKKLSIEAPNNSVSAKYVKEVSFNTAKVDDTEIDHNQIKKGGTLLFEMSDRPVSTSNNDISREDSLLKTDFVPTPFIATEQRIFEDSIVIKIGSSKINNLKQRLYFSINNGLWQDYIHPFTIHETSTVSVKASRFPDVSDIPHNAKIAPYWSPVVKSLFSKRDPRVSLNLETQYANQYAASGPNTLIDGVRGGADFRTGDWQGYFGKDLNAVVSFEEARELTSIGISCIRDIKSWIFYPERIGISYSLDGINFTALPDLTYNEATTDDYEPKTKACIQKLKQPTKIKYIKYTVYNPGKCPSWHLGSGNDSWIFLDEFLYR